jgi:TRAP-type C4-dicarboxylate transport system permease small subunit
VKLEWERRVDAVLGVAASAILFCMMTLTFVDVVARYVFNRPLRGAFEVTELMLLVLIFAGLPLVTHAGEHVTMDLIDRFLGAPARHLMSRLVELGSAALMFLLTWLMWIKAGRIAGYGDTTDVLRITVGPFVYFMTAMILLSGLIHLYRVFSPSSR